MARVIATRCPICGMSRSHKESDESFFLVESDLDDFIRIQEVGGSEKTGRGIGRGKAKGKVETMETYPMDKVPEEYEHILEEMKERIEIVLERMEE